jgi:hypothetical protein
MIIRNFLSTRKDGVNLFINFSDKGVKIRKVGTSEIYDEAIDVQTAPFVYEETNLPIEVIKEENSILENN